MNDSTASPKSCPRCGVALPLTATAGLCPRCLMAEAMAPTQADAEPAAQPPLPPEQIAPHFPQLEILECLGRGGMGVVYKARQKSLGRLVALKLLAPERVRDAKFAERFTREAQALAALNHPNIVTIHDFGQAGGFYYLLMEFVDGLNLRQLLRMRKFTPEEALAVVPPLCDALQFAHERGIVHRDIKPENLLLDKAGRVKVADFGIAKMFGAVNAGGKASEPATPENATQAAVGTPAYSAPEQKTDPQRVDSRADIYSLGVVFYEMLTGELPGKRIEPPSHKVQIDVRLDEVVLRALENKPELRYQQASEVKTMVETIVATPPGNLSSEPSQIEKPKARRRFSRPAVVIAALLALIVITFSLLHVRTPVELLSQQEFLQKFASNQIVQATITVNQQPLPLSEIRGTYYKAGQDGVIIKQSNGNPVEVPFEVHNAWFAPGTLNDLVKSPKIAIGPPNKVVLNLFWGLMPFVVIGVGLFVIPGIIIYILWRARKKPPVNSGPPTIQKPDRFWRWFAVAVFAMIAVPFVISILGLLAAIAIPNFVRAREQAQANAQRQAVAANNARPNPATQEPSAITPPAGPVELKLKWPPVGERLVLDIATKRNGEYLTPGQPDSLMEYMIMDKKIGLTLLEATPGGGHEVELEFLSFMDRIVLGGMTVLDYDSTQNPSVLATNALTDLYGKVAGSKIRFFLNASNDIERMEGVDELQKKLSGAPVDAFSKIQFSQDYLKEMMTSLYRGLPSQAVQPGDTWPFQAEMAMSPVGTANLNCSVIFQRWEQHWNRNCARLEFQTSVKTKTGPNSNPTGTSVSSFEGTISGVTWFDPKQGMAIESTANNDMKMVLNNLPINQNQNPAASGTAQSTIYQWHDAINTTVLEHFVLESPNTAISGIGVVLGVDGENIVVWEIIPGSPAAAQKDIHPGDRIIAAAQVTGPAVPLQSGKMEQAAALIQGPAGTTVRLTLVSSGDDDSHARVVSFVRAELKPSR